MQKQTSGPKGRGFAPELIGALLALFIGFNAMLGFEPMNPIFGKYEYMRNFTLIEYMHSCSRGRNYPTVMKVVAILVYPGAKVGRLYHNSQVN